MRRLSAIRRFLAFLTILSVTLTQACPAWALRTESGGSPAVRAGLEETLLGAAGGDPTPQGMAPLRMAQQALSYLNRSKSNPTPPAVFSGEVPPFELVAAVWAGMTALPESQKTMVGKVIGALKLFQQFQVPGNRSAYDEAAIASEIGEITKAAPHACLTCAARGLASIASSPDFGLRESFQTPEFRDAETATALLIAVDVWLTGRVLSVEEPGTGHRVFANSMASVQAVYEAAEFGVEPKRRRNWLPRSLDFSQLQVAMRQGPVLAHVGENHFAPILAMDERQVTLAEVLWDAEGGAVYAAPPMARARFEQLWAGDEKEGRALIGVPVRVHSLPGRMLPSAEVKQTIGCCGVSFGSSVDGLISKSGASQDIVRVLESRGFDNYAAARKMRIDLPKGFNLADPRYLALSDRIRDARLNGKEDLVYVEGNGETPPSLRFFAISRGVGSNTANVRVIESAILHRMEEIAQLVHGGGIRFFQIPSSGNWEVLRGRRKIDEIKEDAAADHTRFKTKGDDRGAHAHHWSWKGASLGVNGDDETFNLLKAILGEDFQETFEGETDSEVDNHLVGDLQEEKDVDGHVVGHVPSERALIRTLRLLENVEAIRQASVVLQPEYAAIDLAHKAEQEAVRQKLQELGIDPDKVARTVKLQGFTVPVFLREFVNSAVRNPALMDRLATKENGWKGYYRRLGTQLPQTKEKHFDNPKNLNLSMNLLSLHDNHSAVVARSYDKSTEFSFGFGRNERSGEVEIVLGGSEPRGFASLIGRYNPQDAIPIRPGIVDLVNGSVEQLKARDWSVYTVDKTVVTRHDVWTDEVEKNLQGEETKIRWTAVRSGQEAKDVEWTAFRLETTAQPITLYLTLDALTESDESGIQRVHLAEATDRMGPEAEPLKAALADPNTKIFGGASGTSYHALLKTNAQYHLFDGLQSSDQWLSGLISNQIQYEIAQGRRPIFIIVSQSGTTGAAINLAKQLIGLGAIVLGVTNVPGSGIYSTTKASGGVVVTQSLNETAVAATGSNTSQLAALELIAMKRREAVALAQELPDIQRTHGGRIRDLIRLTTHVVPGGEQHVGILQGTLDGFNPEQPNQKTVSKMVNWIKQSELEEVFADKTAFRNLNIILTGIGSVAQALAPEIGLKVMEVTRKTAAYIPVQELLAHTGRPEEFNPQRAIRSVEDNLKRFTTGKGELIGKYPHFPTMGREDLRLRNASELLLLGDGESQVALEYIVARYQTASPVPVKKGLFASAPSAVRRGALVIAVQPWTAEQASLLEGYRKQGAAVVVIATPEAQGLPVHAGTVAQAAAEGTLIQTVGDEWRYAHVTVLDLFMMRVMEALQGKLRQEGVKNVSTDYATASFLAQEVGHLQEQIDGMRQVADSFDEQRVGGRHRNAISFQRLSRYYKARGWGHFDWWATGKGPRYAAARDLSLLAWSRIGKQMGTAEGSEFKHGYSAATNIGDNFFNVWSKKGTPDWGDDKKTVLEELVPRVADYPYPVFDGREPGLMVLLAAADPNDDYLTHLSDAEYDRLRTLRRTYKRPKGATTVRPDVVFVTPHGGFLEQLMLNRMLIQRVEQSLGEYLSEQGLRREQVIPRTLVLSVDIGESLPGKQAIYDRLRELFPADRNRIVSISGVSNQQAVSHSDQQIIVNDDDPIASIVVGHQLTTQLVESRFGHVLEWLVGLNHALQDEIKKGAEGTVGRFAPDITTPGALLYGWAIREPAPYRALQEFSRSHPKYGDLEAQLLDILDWYNLDPIQSMGAAHDIHELNRSTIDLISKLAKVVTNASGIRVQNAGGQAPVVMGTATLAASPAVVFAPEMTAALQNDPNAVEQLREILIEVRGPSAISSAAEAAQVVEAFTAFAASALTEAIATIRERRPTAPESTRVNIQIHGNLLAHQADGQLSVNVHAFRHPALLAQQLEHELGHEMLGPVMGQVALPSQVSGSVDTGAVRRVLEELIVLRAEAGWFLAYPPEEQHAVLEILQGPNPVDPTGEFNRLLQQLLESPQQEWNVAILGFIQNTRPELASAAQIWIAAPAEQLESLVASTAQGVAELSPGRADLSAVENRLTQELRSRGRPASQIAQFPDLFRSWGSTGQPTSVNVVREGGYVAIYAVFPYREPSPGIPNPNIGIGDSLREMNQRENRSVQPHDLFITTVRESPTASPVALFRLEMNNQADADFVVKRLGALLAPYNASGTTLSAVVQRPAVTPTPAAEVTAQAPRVEPLMETPTQVFMAEVTKALDYIGLPAAGSMVDQVRVAFEVFAQSGEPQVELFGHPFGNLNQAIVVAIHRDRPGMEADVIVPISDEDEVGANYRTTGARTVGNTAFVILDIADVGKKGPSALKDAVRKIRSLLSAPVVPDSLRNLLQPYQAQMEGTSVRAIYAAYKNLQNPQTRNYVQRSRYVPDRSTQSALTIIIRDEERLSGLDAAAREIIQQNQLQIVPSAGTEMAFDVGYQENPSQQGVRILRYVVNAPRDDPRVVEAWTGLTERVGGEVTAAAPAIPDSLQPHRDVVDLLIRSYGTSQKTELRLLPGPTPTQTLVVISGRPEEPGILLNVLTETMAKADIPLSNAGIYSTDPGGVAYVIADASEQELRRTHTQNEKLPGTSVENALAGAIVARFPTPEQRTFREWLLLQQGRNDVEVKWLENLSHFYHGMPKIAIEVVPQNEGGETVVVGLAPYAPPLGMSEKDFTRAVQERAQQLANEFWGDLPAGKADPITTFFRSYEIPHPMVVVQLNFHLSRDQLFDSRIVDAVEEVLIRLAAPSAFPTAGGLEETLAQAVPLEQVPVTYPASGAPDFAQGSKFLFVSLVAGDATRWQKSIAEASRQAEFTVTDPVSGQPVIRSKVLTPVSGAPGFPDGQSIPVGWLPISAAKALGGKAIAIVGSQKELVVQEFSQLDGGAGDVSFAEQTVRDGTGGALWRSLAVGNLREANDLPVVVGAGDQPLFDATFFEQILGALKPGVDLVVGTSTVPLDDARGKGRIVRDRTTDAILGILEQKDIDAIKQGQAQIPQAYQDAGWTTGEDLDAIREINTGVYSVRVGTMEQALSGVTNQNAQKQFYATDMISELLKRGKVVSSVDVPVWRMPDVTTVNDLPGVVAALAAHRELRFTAGLEEAPALSPLDLALPSRWPSFDEVVKRLNEALTSSGFLKTVRIVRSIAQAQSTGVLNGYRRIAKEETDALAENGVVAENWSSVYVPIDGLTQGDVRRMRDLRLLGTVYLGHLKGNVRFSDGAEVPSEISNSVLRDVVVGNNVLIKDNILIERYVIGDGAVVTQNRKVTAEKGTDFGIGKPIPVGPETGGREIKTYPEILLGDVVRLVRSPGDKDGQAQYAQALAKYLDAAKSDFGYIGRGAEVSGVADGKNLFVADGGVVVDNTNVHNLVLLTAEGERTVVAGTSEIVNLTAQPGVEIIGANVVMGVDDGAHGVLMMEHSHAGNGATIKDSVIAPNTGVEKGEVTSSLMGPFIGMHHESLIIAVDWADGMGNVGAGVREGSNHTGRAPDQEMRNGEGVFLGLASIYSFSGNFADSPYTIFGKGVSMLPTRVAMPFSLVQKPTVQIPGESPEFMEISPGWVWSDNAYMPMRNEGKYASRDKSSRNGLRATGKEDPLLRRTPFEILRPDTINQMIRARDVLAAVNPKSAREWLPPKVDGEKSKEPDPIRYYTGTEIPQLGKTFVQEEALINGRDTYTTMIQHYGAKGLWAEVQRLAAANRLSEVPTLLTTPSTDLRWEHERRVLLQELPGKSVPDILRFLVESQKKLADQVRTSKEKDDKRGERLLDDYRETHTAAANDKFIKQSAAAAAKLQQEVEALLPQLGGLEEAPIAVTEVERGILPESDTAVVESGVSIIAGPHVSALALGAALSKVTTPDGQPAAQVVFVVENEAETELVNQLATPLMVFSASDPQYGSIDAALVAARDLMRGADVQELGTNNQPVSESIQLILYRLFGIELGAASLPVWQSYVDRVTGVLSGQA